MKTSLLCLFVLSALLAVTHAGRGGRGRGRGAGRGKGKNAGCSEWVMGECVPKTGDCGRGTKNGTRSGDECAVKEKTFKCRKPCAGGGPGGACKYTKKDAVKSECDPTTNMRTITLTLKKGRPECEKTKVIERPCRRRPGKRNRGGKGKKKCRYQRGEWSECDTTTNTRTRTLTLKKGDPSECPVTKTKTRRCKRAKCTFGPWSPFGECQNGVKTKTREIVSGGDACQNRTSKTRPCRN